MIQNGFLRHRGQAPDVFFSFEKREGGKILRPGKWADDQSWETEGRLELVGQVEYAVLKFKIVLVTNFGGR